MGNKYDFFTEKELACRCGKCGLGQDQMSPTFMQRLIILRTTTGIPMPLTSAVRCCLWNNKVSSTGFIGPHVMCSVDWEEMRGPLGHAVDIKLWGAAFYKVLKATFSLGFTGIGIQQKGPYRKRFLHLDDLPVEKGRPRPWVWSY